MSAVATCPFTGIVPAVRREDPLPRPGPGERLRQGPETMPRQAATVMLLRGGEHALEVLLVRRNPRARFMAGVWVFPGGALDAEEQASPEGHRLAARRELREEASIDLDQSAELIAFSRWITPAAIETRYDTTFFLAELPPHQQVSVDGGECVAHRWSEPQAALTAYAADELPLVFPTLKHLEQLGEFSSAAQLIERSRGRPIGPVQPKVVVEDGKPQVLLPGEPGY